MAAGGKSPDMGIWHKDPSDVNRLHLLPQEEVLTTEVLEKNAMKMTVQGYLSKMPLLSTAHY